MQNIRTDSSRVSVMSDDFAPSHCDLDCMFVSIPSAPAQEVFPNPLPLALPSTVVHAQDFNKTVVPITELKLIGLGIAGKFGTGFCLDPECRFIGTNYHVAMMARPRKIKGEKVIQRYLATGPDDEGATVNDGPSVGPMKYTLSRTLPSSNYATRCLTITVLLSV